MASKALVRPIQSTFLEKSRLALDTLAQEMEKSGDRAAFLQVAEYVKLKKGQKVVSDEVYNFVAISALKSKGTNRSCTKRVKIEKGRKSQEYDVIFDQNGLIQSIARWQETGEEDTKLDVRAELVAATNALKKIKTGLVMVKLADRALAINDELQVKYGPLLSLNFTRRALAIIAGDENHDISLRFRTSEIFESISHKETTPQQRAEMIRDFFSALLDDARPIDYFAALDGERTQLPWDKVESVETEGDAPFNTYRVLLTPKSRPEHVQKRGVYLHGAEHWSDGHALYCDGVIYGAPISHPDTEAGVAAAVSIEIGNAQEGNPEGLADDFSREIGRVTDPEE